MFEELEKINHKPEPFEFYTASDLWTDEYTSKQMLFYHLKEDVDMSSRNIAFIDKSVDWIAANFNIGPDTQIADFGCGPGLYASRLAGKQAKVTGIDFSKRSIEYARNEAKKEGLSINYINQNYLDFKTDEKFNLIIMIMCDFCVLSPAQRKTMLKKFNNLLVPGGSILLDVYSYKAFEQREEAATYEVNQLNSFWSPDKYYGFVNTFKYEQEKVVLDKYTIIEAARTRTIYNWLQYFSPEQLENELKEYGLVIENYYSNVAGDKFDINSNEFAIIAREE